MSWEAGGGKSPSEQGWGSGSARRRRWWRGCHGGLGPRAPAAPPQPGGGRSGTQRQGPGPPEGLPDGVRTAAGSGTPLHRGDAQPRLTHRLPQRRPGSRHPHTHPGTPDTRDSAPPAPARPGPTPPASAAAAATAPLSASVQDGAAPRRPLRGALARPRQPRARPAPDPRPAAGTPPCLLRAGSRGPPQRLSRHVCYGQSAPRGASGRGSAGRTLGIHLTD